MTRRGVGGHTYVMVVTASHRAFVIKLSAAEDSAHIAGSVEHVVSGESARFDALEELGVFLARTLAHEQAEAWEENIE